MKILFISSGNSKNGISSIVSSQGESLKNEGHELSFFTIKGKGLRGYFENILPLRKFLKTNKFDVIHAHYSLSAMIASIAGSKPLIVSLMGSDVKASNKFHFVIKLFNKYWWKKVIVKSEDMKLSSGLKDAFVVPNGVDFQKFYPMSKADALFRTGWDISKQHILFAADPNRKEKNYFLTQQAFENISHPNAQLHVLIDVKSEDMNYYINAADVVVLSSFWEGSPNVVKEAMACNVPVVCTDVGDVSTLFGSTPGYYLSSFDQDDFSNKLQQALKFSPGLDSISGRDRIVALGLDATTVARKLISIYNLHA